MQWNWNYFPLFSITRFCKVSKLANLRTYPYHTSLFPYYPKKVIGIFLGDKTAIPIGGCFLNVDSEDLLNQPNNNIDRSQIFQISYCVVNASGFVAFLASSFFKADFIKAKPSFSTRNSLMHSGPKDGRNPSNHCGFHIKESNGHPSKSTSKKCAISNQTTFWSFKAL